MFINKTPLKITVTIQKKLRIIISCNYIYMLRIYNVAIAAHVAGRALHWTEIGTSVLNFMIHRKEAQRQNGPCPKTKK